MRSLGPGAGRRGLAVLLAVAVAAAAACSGGGDEGGGTRSRRSPATATTTTTEAAAPAAPAAEAPPEHPLGAKWNWFQYRNTPGFQAGVERLAGGSTFLEVVWCWTDREGWSLYDDQVGQAAALGFELMIKLRTGTCGLTGGADDGSPLDDPSSLPADPAAYDAWVTEAVGRYAARGVHLWAIENEVDARNAWSPAPADYEPFARRVAGVIQAADPEAVIYDSGLSGTVYGVSLAADRLAEGDTAGATSLYEGAYERGDQGTRRFPPGGDAATVEAAAEGDTGRRVREALDVSLRLAQDGVVDRWQLHWYEPVAVLPEALGDLRARLPAGFPIEAWEAGVFWPGDGYDRATHAGETVRLVAELLAAGVERVVYLPVFYTLGGSQPRELWRGLYEPTGETRPAATAYEAMVALTTGAAAFEPLPGGGLGIDREDGSAVVLWDRSLPAPPPGATAADAAGAPMAWTAGTTVGAAPVVVRSPGDLADLRDALAL